MEDSNRYQLTDKTTGKVYVGTAKEIEDQLSADFEKGQAYKSLTVSTIRKYGKRNQDEGWSNDYFEVGIL